ncbi:H-NS family nucleoid-associated regulatory protein [Paraburkholderia azotifigens]|uniref:Histone n=1 Tax=Paraburkholderia azotifigens TaxID=2057004 RepID=A0A5C6V8C1_9BURK|nr:H-NS family nucleoid-associated regulatory protein [Paraburkholderia azotifigens]TXC81044.1 histone [Paraburkholderia azotifigens]
MATLEKLQSQIAKLQARANELISRQSSVGIAKIRDIMEKHGLTIADIDAHIAGNERGGQPQQKVSVASTASLPKYRNPKTGATWTGHGRAPAWIASAKDRNRFLTERGEGAAPTGPAAKRVGNYPTGPQPAKYRDPKTGATWSGRGRAPAWLAGVKDLSSFLIDGSPETSESTTAGPAKTRGMKKGVNAARTQAIGKKAAATKKPAVKKTVAKAEIAAKPATKKVSATPVKTAAKKAAAKRVAAQKAAAKGSTVTRKAAKKVAVKSAAKVAEPAVETPAALTGETATADA